MLERHQCKKNKKSSSCYVSMNCMVVPTGEWRLIRALAPKRLLLKLVRFAYQYKLTVNARIHAPLYYSTSPVAYAVHPSCSRWFIAFFFCFFVLSLNFLHHPHPLATPSLEYFLYAPMPPHTGSRSSRIVKGEQACKKKIIK